MGKTGKKGGKVDHLGVVLLELVVISLSAADLQQEMPYELNWILFIFIFFLLLFFTAHQRSLGEVMVSQVSVNLLICSQDGAGYHWSQVPS